MMKSVTKRHRSVHVRQFGAALAATLVCLGAAWPLAASAQVGGAPQIAGEREDVADPPGRVGRLAEITGTVWLFHPEAGEWMAADRNRPLTSGDRLSTDPGGRVEVRIGSTSLRLDGSTELELTRLDDERIDLDLHGGSLAVRVRSNEATRDMTVETDAGRFTMQRTGRYRFDQRDGLSQATVWSGQALYEGPESALTVNDGQHAEFWIDANRRAQYRLGDAQNDSFASWVADRDRSDDRVVASRYVSPEMTGAEDLDRYGRWEQDPEYGALWTPRDVPADWAPYATGQWSWVSPWGWTWVDAAPWGFAPFHYGRWVQVRDRWGWAPGRYVARPVYAPALVGWVGGSRGNVSVSIGGGPGVGWFPLAPREAYLPWNRVSPRYVRTVNGPHFRNGGDIDRLIQSPSTVLRDFEYRNRKFHHGTTAAPIDAFQRRGPIAVSPQWRGSPASRDFERLPASPVGVLAPPAWVGARRDGRDGRDGPGSGRDGWRDGRRDQSRGGVVSGGAPATPSATTFPSSRDGGRDRDRDRGTERPAMNQGNDWPVGRSRPALPPGTVMEQPALVGRQPAMPAAAPVVPAQPQFQQPPQVQQQPAPRFDGQQDDRRFNRQRPERGFERSGERGGNDRNPNERPFNAPQVQQPQPQPQFQQPQPQIPEAPRMTPPRAAMPPPAAPQMRPPEPVRAAPPANVGQPPSRDPRDGREQRDAPREPRGVEGRPGKPQ